MGKDAIEGREGGGVGREGKGTHFAEDDFGRQILGGAAQGPCPSLYPLCEPEIGDLDRKGGKWMNG